MPAPIGLYGHVQANHRRSLLLFAMFAVAFQLMMAVGLALALLLFDPAYTPMFHPWAYVRRYVPWVFLLSIVLFAVQMWWFVGAVRKQTRFRYVDSDDEPRFCRILEPLAIAAGIQVPYAAVIDTPALNAFACGVRDDHTVVVATRGLIDGLDDDELAAVLANTVIHIRNRDTRLLAAATVFMRNMTILQKERGLKLDHPMQVLPLVVFPVFLPLMLIFGFLTQLAFRVGYASRALIGISRELIADAEGVRLTHNPAALVTALQKIARRNEAGAFRDEHAAMLVYGVTEGPLATHPSLRERLGALARTTGSMVLDTRPRLDTRAPELRHEAGVQPSEGPDLARIATLAETPEQRGFWGAFRSVRDPERNLFGLNARGGMIISASLIGIGLLYADTFRQPDPLPKLFDLATARQFSGVGATYAGCVFAFNASAAEKEQCEKQAADASRLFAHLPGMGALSGKMREVATDVPRGCFDGRWDGAARGSASPPNTLATYLRFGAEGTKRFAGLGPGPQLDAALIEYAETRLLLLDNSLHFFGESGLAAFREAVDTDEHRTVVATLASRLQDPEFLSRLSPRTRANISLLAERPLDIRPC
jgi:Zn-dependent protease with chaperone function